MLPEGLTDEEVSGFLRACKKGICKFDNEGRCLLPSIRRVPVKPTEPRLIGFRGHRPYLAWREYVVQVGFLAELLLDYGYEPSLVALDPERDWAFDLAVYARSGSMVIAVEVKKSRREIEAEMKAIASRTSNKYRGLIRHRARYFWAVAPGYRRAFRIDSSGGEIVMAEIGDIPKAQ